MLYEAIKKISLKQMTTIATLLICIWIFMPIVIMILNLTTVAFVTYNTWFASFFIIGDLGVLLGTAYLFYLISNSKLTTKKKLIALFPIFLILLFGLWSFVCTEKASLKFIAYLGYFTALDGLTSYFSYFGFILLGLIVSNDKKKLSLIANFFIVIASAMAILSLINNSFTSKLFINIVSNCFEYQGVFYNTNHYGYYLTVVILLSGFLFASTKSKHLKILYISSFVINSYLLILNNTMGSYIGVFLTLIFVAVWSFINKEKDKKYPIVLFAIFAIISALSLLIVPNVIDNFKDLYYGILALLSNGELGPQKVTDIGSGRGLLWKYALLVSNQNPIFGIGLQNTTSSAHNMFLQISTYTGFVGLALYLLIYVVGAIRLFKVRKTSTRFQNIAAFIMIGYLISGFFGVTMFYTAPYFYIILGITLSGTLKELSIKEDNNGTT